MENGTVFWASPFLDASLLVTILPSIAAPSFNGTGESFPGNAMEVDLRRQVANFDNGKCASALVLQTEPIATDVCMAMGSS